MAPHAQVLSVIDSLHHVVAHKDSLLLALQSQVDSLLAAGPDTVVRVALPADMPSRPWYESTFVGVLVGGLIATGAGAGAQWFGRFLDNRKKRARLKRRIQGTLAEAVLIAQNFAKKDETHWIELQPLRGLLVSWTRYDRMSDDLGLLGLPELEDKIDAALGFIQMVADKVVADEEAYRRIVREVGALSPTSPTGYTVDAELETRIHGHRKFLLAKVARMGKVAFELLDECNKVWPSRPWYTGVDSLSEIARDTPDGRA